jgi:hypothetical protein
MFYLYDLNVKNQDSLVCLAEEEANFSYIYLPLWAGTRIVWSIWQNRRQILTLFIYLYGQEPGYSGLSVRRGQILPISIYLYGQEPG